ncbi:hypothetical protein KHM83_01100 [Fusibacter paucivorans]|uniref:Uncharacterized protein n=1 Tax=Fusibacter paucivorans TaxID=76009 RepID=A0ABS5PJV4_9FIRM|nr:hypothetical protein [Fusibacter paucivorans]MBS7525266.1 hypothetical protein [Fusibacter paucivorans]
MSFAGIYKVKLPFLVGFKPQLEIVKVKDKKRYTAVLKWLKRSWQLETVMTQASQIVFQWHIDIVHIEIDLRFLDEQSFYGIVDFPVGHFEISGSRLNSAEDD